MIGVVLAALLMLSVAAAQAQTSATPTMINIVRKF